MDDWSGDVERILRSSGWTPNRRVAVEGWRRTLAERGGFAMHPAAERFLTEFGALTVTSQGPGRSMARQSFTLDPTCVVYEQDRFDGFASLVNGHLFPVGELTGDNQFIGIDEGGVLYLVMDDLARLGSPSEGISRLVEGIAPERLGG